MPSTCPPIPPGSPARVEIAAPPAERAAWTGRIKASRPDGRGKQRSKLHCGPVASGEKVVDDPGYRFFVDAKAKLPDLYAVEMEGAGAGTAVEHARTERLVGFFMIRGISDVPRDGAEQGEQPRGTAQRDAWKRYAAAAAAAFLEHLLTRPGAPPPLDEEATSPKSTPDRAYGPNAPPGAWNVPHARNPAFTGREDLVAQLGSVLGQGGQEQSGPPAQAIHGLGGVGKTQLAVEFAYRHAAEYDTVWWLRAGDPVTLASDYAGLAGALRLPEAASVDQPGAIAAVRRWLEREGRRWLLVFDNADRPADLDPYLPRTGAGRVLITSPSPTWPARVGPLAVPVLPPADAVAFLLKRTGQKDGATAAVLAEELGHLPLALEQAAAYVAARGLTLAGYLERFRAQRLEVLERGEPTDYRASVATTWELALRGAAEQALGAAELLGLCAFFAPDVIPLDVVSSHAEVLPDPLRTVARDPVALDDAVVALRRYSLVEAPDDRTLSVHRLVQLVVRAQGSLDDQRRRALAAVELVTAAFPGESEDVRTWPAGERLVAHALAALGHLESLRTTYYDGSGFRGRVGIYLFRRGRFAEARRVLARAVAVAEAVLAPDSPELAKRLANLAMVLRAQGDPDGARRLLERAVRIEVRVLPPTHPQLATDLSNLAAVLLDRGDLDGARGRLEQAVAIHEAALGADHPAVAIDRSNLADALRRQGDLDGAAAQLERALAMGEASLGSDHPAVAARLVKLAEVTHERGDPTAARALLDRAMAVDQRALGPAYPGAAEHLGSIADLYRRWGDPVAARPLLERVLAITEAALGPHNPDVATALNNLGVALYEQGRPAESRPLLERAVAIREPTLGPDDPGVATALATLALVARDQGGPAAARQQREPAPAAGAERAGVQEAAGGGAPRDARRGDRRAALADRPAPLGAGAPRGGRHRAPRPDRRPQPDDEGAGHDRGGPRPGQGAQAAHRHPQPQGVQGDQGLPGGPAARRPPEPVRHQVRPRYRAARDRDRCRQGPAPRRRRGGLGAQPAPHLRDAARPARHQAGGGPRRPRPRVARHDLARHRARPRGDGAGAAGARAVVSKHIVGLGRLAGQIVRRGKDE